MKLTANQTKLIELTKNLEKKTKEYHSLCREFENLKNQNINPNDLIFLNLEKRFLINQEEIKEIVDNLKMLKNEND